MTDLLTLVARAMAEEYCGRPWDALNEITRSAAIDAQRSALLCLADGLWSSAEFLEKTDDSIEAARRIQDMRGAYMAIREIAVQS